MSFDDLTAKDLIDPEWFPTYQLQVNALWQQLIQLNSNIRFIEKIEEFPFDLFNTDKNAWQMIKNALIESTVMLIWRIAYDNDPKVLTLKKLKVGTQKHIHEKFKSSLENHFNEFESQSGKLKKHIMKIRHKYFAHLDITWNTEPTVQMVTEISVKLDDFRTLLSACKKIFDTLTFDIKYSFDFFPQIESSLEETFDSIVLNHPLFRSPETDPDYYELFFFDMSDSDLEIFNQYRRKFNLPEIVKK